MPSLPDAERRPWSLRLLSELEAADRRALEIVKGLDAAQLNWNLRPQSWSIAQCLDQLLLANNVYLPALASALRERRRTKVPEITPGLVRPLVHPQLHRNERERA